MAVEARRLPLFPPQQLLSNRELMNTVDYNDGFCITQTANGVVPAISAAETPILHQCNPTDAVNVQAMANPLTPHLIKSVDTSSFTYCGGGDNINNNGGNTNCDVLPLPSSRKRSRDFMANYAAFQNSRSCVPFSFLNQDVSLQIQQQQHEINRLIALHIERVKMEMEEKRKRQLRTIMEAIEQGLVKRLRAKEEEREKLGKLNHALEERVKSLSVENQIWRDLAHTNEATANALRTNLEQVMAQVKDVRTTPGVGLDDAADDAQSCCGSSSGGGGGEEAEAEVRTLAGKAQDKGTSTSRTCRNCGEEESCVLLLPCRHLCLCGICGSHLHTCPICKSPKNASVHVNMSS